MSSELERRLESLLAEIPEPEDGVGEEALARALSALRPAAPRHRGLRTAVLVLATVVVLLAVAAGSLAAAGALHVSFGAKKEQRPAITQLSLPKGANGIAAIVDGRLSVVIKGGFRLQGLRVTAAALSPHALYVAAGIGESLVAMAPDGRRAWSHPAGGRVVAIAWAPDGLRLAYVVRANHRFALHVIWGNGTHDQVIDRSVRAVRPSWRADSLALAYVSRGGSAVVYDLGHASRRVVVRSTSLGGVTQLAFVPTGSALVVGGRTGMVYATRHPHRYRVGPVAAVAWLSKSLVVVADGSFQPGFAPPVLDKLSGAGAVVAFASSAGHFVVGVGSEGQVRLVAGTPSRFRTVALLPPEATLRDLQIG
jgi:hypothetical protein